MQKYGYSPTVSGIHSNDSPGSRNSPPNMVPASLSDESPDENFGKESSGSSPSLSSKKKGRKPDVPPRPQTPKSKRENDDSIGSRKSSDTGSKRNSSIDIGKRKSSDTGSKRNSSIDTGIDHRKSSDSSSKRNASISSHQGIL